MSSHLLERAVRLWKSGQIIPARQILTAIIYNDRRNEAAWTWYIYTLDTNQEKIAALETFLNIFPQHTTAIKALATLRAQTGRSSILKTPVEVHPTKDEDHPGVKPLAIQESRPVLKPPSSGAPWIGITLGLCLFLCISALFSSRYNSLQSENKRLASNYHLISQDLAKLNGDYDALRAENIGLTDEHNSLTTKFNALNNEYSALLENYNSLSADSILW
jgi:hypothetical protein